MIIILFNWIFWYKVLKFSKIRIWSYFESPYGMEVSCQSRANAGFTQYLEPPSVWVYYICFAPFAQNTVFFTTANSFPSPWSGNHWPFF